MTRRNRVRVGSGWLLGLAAGMWTTLAVGSVLAAEAPLTWQAATPPAGKWASQGPGYGFWAHNAGVVAEPAAAAPSGSGLVWEAAPGAFQPGGYLTARQGETQMTVTARLSFSADEGRHRLWLAGLALSPEGPPTALALSLVGEFSGWFGFSGSLRVESAGGLLPATVRTGTEATPLGPVEYAELARNVPLAADHTYAATLSFDGTTGLAAVALIDRSDDSLLYEGHLYVRPASGSLYAGVGGARLDGGTEGGWRLEVDEMTVLPEVRRLGLPLPLKEVHMALAGHDGEAPIGRARAVPAVYADAQLEIAVRGVRPGGFGPPWSLRLVAVPADAGVGAAHRTLWQGRPGETARLVIAPGTLPPGRYQVVAEYVEPNYVAQVAGGEIAMIAAGVQAEVAVVRNQPWETNGAVSGEIALRADRDLEAVELTLQAAPEDAPDAAVTVWRGSAALKRGEARTVPFGFTGPVRWSPYTFFLAVNTPRLVEVAAAYYTPRVFHVSPQGDDRWSGYFPAPRAGNADGPFRTISRAARAVEAGDTVILHTGVYREAVVIEKSGAPDRPITFRAAPAASVAVTSADRLTNWLKVPGDENIYSTPWPHVFISWNESRAHPDDDYHKLIGRAEQVLVGGYLLRQVLSREQMARGTFYVDLADQKLYVWSADNRDIAKAGTVEASTRNVIWRSNGAHVHVHGLHFRYAANRAQEGAVQIAGDHNVLEDCVVEKMNASGAAFLGQNISVRRCIFQENGQLGFGANRAHNLLISESTVRNNNTKGYSRGWEAGANKLVFTRGAVIEKSLFVENKGTGIWFDIGNEDATVRNNLIAYNEEAGIFYEISYGLHAHDNVIIGNGGPVDLPRGGSWGANGGIAISSSPGAVIERNLLIGNREGFQFREQTRTTPRIDDPKEQPVWNHDAIIRNNVIAYNHDAQTWGWFDINDERHWPAGMQGEAAAGEPARLSLEKLNIVFQNNFYATAGAQALFNWGVEWKRHKRYATLDDVRRELGLEQGSVVGPFAFGDYHQLDFRVPADSPALKMGSYPQGSVPGVELGTLD